MKLRASSKVKATSSTFESRRQTNTPVDRSEYERLSTVSELIERAFARLLERPSFLERPDQRQLALLLSDMIEQKSMGAFEAPTGLGKSLACLIPAIAHAIVSKRRVVIATYTNVLAEQYWREDLPLAMSLFQGEELPRTQLLMGRQRYACMAAVDEHAPDLVDMLRICCDLGIESEFRKVVKRPSREMTALWQKVAAPPICPGRLCPAYDDCFYYRARRGAERAEIVITNHSVVMQHAIFVRSLEDEEGLIGKIDYLVLDEAHDFLQAAGNALEFELSTARLQALIGVAARMENSVLPIAERCGDGTAWIKDCATFRSGIEECQTELAMYGMTIGRQGILTAAPQDLLDHPQVQAIQAKDQMAGAQALAEHVCDLCDAFVKSLNRRLEQWKDDAAEGAKMVGDSVRPYGLYLREYGMGCYSLFDPQGVAVSYCGRNFNEPILRQDVIGLAAPLTELLWSKTPTACLSATLAVDGSFDYFKRSSGFEPDFEEILPSPFDYSIQAALYVPPVRTIPDPTIARREGSEESYYRALARELGTIIQACGGRTLALFHSRREMEGVYAFLDLPSDFPVLMQMRQGTAATGERFRREISSSLFALRSFWTGFDAPGETLSCVALVRVPFEVPTDPAQIARLAYLQQQGLDPFKEHTLPQAKMLMRQGAGRLIRRDEDKGIIALLDPRLGTKRYGEEIIENLPKDMRTFRDINDAAGWIGLGNE